MWVIERTKGRLFGSLARNSVIVSTRLWQWCWQRPHDGGDCMASVTPSPWRRSSPTRHTPTASNPTWATANVPLREDILRPSTATDCPMIRRPSYPQCRHWSGRPKKYEGVTHCRLAGEEVAQKVPQRSTSFRFIGLWMTSVKPRKPRRGRDSNPRRALTTLNGLAISRLPIQRPLSLNGYRANSAASVAREHAERATGAARGGTKRGPTGILWHNPWHTMFASCSRQTHVRHARPAGSTRAPRGPVGEAVAEPRTACRSDLVG